MVNKNKPITRHRRVGEGSWHYTIYELGLEEVVEDPAIQSLGEISRAMDHYINQYNENGCIPRGLLQDMPRYAYASLCDGVRQLLKDIRDKKLDIGLHESLRRTPTNEIITELITQFKTDPKIIYGSVMLLMEEPRNKILNNLPVNVRAGYDKYLETIPEDKRYRL